MASESEIVASTAIDRSAVPGKTINRQGLERSTSVVFWTQDRIGLALALLISGVIAAVLEGLMLGYAVPPGQDEGEWIATSYAYVGLPTPSQIVPLAYPPALFPYLGLLVRLTGNPFAAALAFVGSMAVLLGVATYWLARTMLRSVLLGLFVEAAFLLNPSTIRIFFWGGYPTIFGLVFVALSLACLFVYIRERPNWAAALFWSFAAVAVLSESLIATTLLGTIAILGLLLIVFRKFPVGVVRSRGGLLGIGVFALLVGSYYGVTFVDKVPRANYAQASAYAHVLTSLGGFYQPLIGFVAPGFSPSSDAVFASLVVFTVATAAALCAVRLLRPAWLTESTLVVFSWVLAGFLIAIAGWQLNIITVFGRIAYLLILPILLGLALIARRVFVEVRRAWERRRATADADRAATLVGYRGGWVHRARADPIFTLALLVGVVAMLLLAGFATAPSIPTDERFFAQPAHGSSYVTAVNAIGHSSAHGGVIVGVPQSGRWPRAMILRNTFSPLDPAIVGTQDFYPYKVLDSELAFFALDAQYAATNGIVSASYAGNQTAFMTGVPDYAPMFFGHSTPILRLDPTSLVVTTARGQIINMLTANNSSGPAEPKLLHPPAGQSWLGFQFTSPYATVTIIAATVPAAPTVVIGLYANATLPRDNITQVKFAIAQEANQSAVISLDQRGDNFTWTPNRNSALETVGAVRGPGISLSYGGGGAATRSVTVRSAASAKAGTSALVDLITLSTPGAENVIAPGSLPPFLSCYQVWQTLGVSFVLLNNNTNTPKDYPLSGLAEVQWLESDLDATPYEPNEMSGGWVVLLLPTTSR